MHQTINKKLNSVIKVILTVIISLLLYSEHSYGSRVGRANIPFEGTATGGTLIIGYAPDPHIVHLTSVNINTSQGESAESVVGRLARVVVHSERIFGGTSANPDVELARTALGNTLSIVGSTKDFILAGSETGLGIPQPPHSLSCSYNEQAGTIEVKWSNPPGKYKYDSIYIVWRYSNLGRGGGDIVPGTPTSYTIRISPEVNDLDLDVWLKGLRHEIPVDNMLSNRIPLGTNAIPSNVTAIHVTGNGHCQEETYGIPFTSGTAPNWTDWSTAAKIDETAFEQGEKYAGVRRYEPVRVLLAKPYYQVITAPQQGAAHGVYRKFLGLTPGHSYRLIACINTLDMDSITSDWSLSLCATHNGKDGKDLTVQQLAGLAPLPNGRSGPEAGKIVSYNRNNTTKGDFSIVLTGVGPQNSHITLPAGSDTITVWIRFSCSDPKGKIGFSGVKLEDISANPNPKSPEQIEEEEFKEEANLIKWIERASSR